MEQSLPIFNKARKDATDFTIQANARIISYLPFNTEEDLEDYISASEGLLKKLEPTRILTAAGTVAWDIS